jgi:hypothetical protein
MNLPSASTQAAANSDLQRPTGTRLQGRWLPLVRLAWVVLSVLALSIFIASLPVHFAMQTRSYMVVYAAFIFTLDIFVALVWFIVAGLIFWRRSNDWLALLVSFMLVAQGVNTTLLPLKIIHSVWQGPAVVLALLAFFLLFLVFCLFPNGRFVPRWIPWLVVLFAGFEVLGILNVLPQSYNLVAVVVSYGFLGSFVVSQLYRYHSVSSPAERQQTKWIVFGVTVTYLFEFGLTFCVDLFPSFFSTGSLADLILSPIGNAVPVLIPLSFGLAILRYRLWDIDIIINRTLVYGTLTILLALVYFSSVIGLQSLLHRFIEGNQLAIVGSTLLIAALFQPLRHRVQDIIDRRFYRRKYDTARTLAAFSAKLRDEVDLDHLSEQLVEVVQETMQPAHVSLWLRSPEQNPEQSTRVLPKIGD